MSKILQYSACLILTSLSICTFSLGAQPSTPRRQWIPASTESVSTRTFNATQSARDERPQTLRALDQDAARKLQVERAISLSYNEDSDAESIARIIAEGDSLMAQRKWYEAKKRFEKGLRVWSEDPVLRSRFAEARRRQEISLRYQDASFATLANAAPVGDVVTIFDEVFSDIDRYYVDCPDYKELFNLGMSGIGESLTENGFYKQHKIPLERREIAQETFKILRDRLQDEELGSKQDVLRAALWVARQLKRRVGTQESAVLSEFLCSAICSLDAYSTPLTPMQVDDVFSLIDGRFVGVGVELKTDAPTKVVRVIPKSPAEESGIKAGDELVEIDAKSTSGLSGVEIGELLQGIEGEASTIRLRTQEGIVRDVVVVRRPIEVPSVENVRILDAPGSIGYAKISCFQKTTSDELAEALKTLERAHARSVIVDLRQNPGGLLQEAVNVSELFLDSGVIVQTRGRNGAQRFTAQNGGACNLPLVLLVDSNSASAAEIFAGAMQENGRGTVVGTQSYGKGTVQAIIQLNASTNSKKPIAGLRLTAEKFYSPKGRAYSGIGVIPDVNVPEELAARERRATTSEPYGANAEENSLNAEERFVGYIKKSPATRDAESDPYLSVGIQEALRLEQNARLALKGSSVVPANSNAL